MEVSAANPLTRRGAQLGLVNWVGGPWDPSSLWLNRGLANNYISPVFTISV